MANDHARAEFWRDFILARSGYPTPDRLRAQFTQAEFSDFCSCGCNSFAVEVRQGTPPLVRPDKDVGVIYEADFKLADERTLEIILFADGGGDLRYVEVDCCANSEPVPDPIEAGDEPFHTYMSDHLLR